MKKLQCELCGSTDMIKIDDDVFQCNHCGCKYTKEQVQKIIGVVETTKGTAEFERNIKKIDSYLRMENYDVAYKECALLQQEYPYEYLAWWKYVEVFMAKVKKCNSLSFFGYDGVIVKHYENFKEIAPENEKAEKQIKWDEFWKETTEKLFYGGFSETSISANMAYYLEHLLIYPVVKKYIDIGRKNAKILHKNGLSFAINRSTYGMRNSGNSFALCEDLGEEYKIYIALGKIISVEGKNGGIASLYIKNIIKTDSESILQYKNEAEQWRNFLIINDICPKCNARKLKSKLFSNKRTCENCQNTFYCYEVV